MVVFGIGSLNHDLIIALLTQVRKGFGRVTFWLVRRCTNANHVDLITIKPMTRPFLVIVATNQGQTMSSPAL